MFKVIQKIADLLPAVAGKKEIRFLTDPILKVTTGCYMFMDSKTFDSPESIECRGVTFDAEGFIISRPLHKFFNVGERPEITRDSILKRTDIVAVYEKLDGSMIATAMVDGKLEWRSKKSFNSDVVKLAKEVVQSKPHLESFASAVAELGMTAIFELQHPSARIVVEHPTPTMTLLHVRDNVTGQYVLLDPTHKIHSLIAAHDIARVRSFSSVSVEGILASLEQMKNKEGYVIQFKNGDMVKLKCPWYLRLHKSVTFLRERDIATLALKEELDDVKSALIELGIDLSDVEAVESRLRENLTNIIDSVEDSHRSTSHLSRKDFALFHKGNQYFPLLMMRYLGSEFSVSEWYLKNRLKEDFTLSSLLSPAQTEALEA